MCTTFVLRSQSGDILAENYDFYYGQGLLCVNPRSLKKTSLHDENTAPITWTAQYGSVTFNQFGRELPTSGMNEAGLAIALMANNDGRFPAKDARPALSELQWIQYQLDRYATIAEALTHLDEVRIEKSVIDLHYSLLDAEGHSAILEWIDGAPIVLRDLKPHVLTNSPYTVSLDFAHGKYALPANLPNDRRVLEQNSLDRFAMAMRGVTEATAALTVTTDLCQAAFRILGSVSMRPTLGSLWLWLRYKIPPSTTFWRIAFNPTQRRILFRIGKADRESSLDLTRLDFSCSLQNGGARLLDLSRAEPGDVIATLEPYSHKMNLKLIRQSFAPVSKQFPSDMQEAFARYPDTFDRMANE